jgi:hypothetical protein
MDIARSHEAVAAPRSARSSSSHPAHPRPPRLARVMPRMHRHAASRRPCRTCGGEEEACVLLLPCDFSLKNLVAKRSTSLTSDSAFQKSRLSIECVWEEFVPNMAYDYFDFGNKKLQLCVDDGWHYVNLHGSTQAHIKRYKGVGCSTTLTRNDLKERPWLEGC